MKCPTCYGRGYDESPHYYYGRTECPECKGTGTRCDTCRGLGVKPDINGTQADDPCEDCQGEGDYASE